MLWLGIIKNNLIWNVSGGLSQLAFNRTPQKNPLTFWSIIKTRLSCWRMAGTVQGYHGDQNIPLYHQMQKSLSREPALRSENWLQILRNYACTMKSSENNSLEALLTGWTIHIWPTECVITCLIMLSSRTLPQLLYALCTTAASNKVKNPQWATKVVETLLGNDAFR